jgi:hypothetical protein
VEKSLALRLAEFQCATEPVLVGCWGLTLWGQTTAALGQPALTEGPGGQVSWRQTQGKGGMSGLFPPGPSECEAQAACLQRQLGGEAALLLLFGSPLPLGRPEASCYLVAGQLG